MRARLEDIATLEGVLAREEEEVAHPHADSGTTAGQFHRAVADCTRNQPLVVLMNALADLTAESVSALDARVRTHHRRKNCEYHRQLLDAIRARDADKAYALMVSHVGDIQSRVSRTMSQAARHRLCGPSHQRARPRAAARSGRR
jgi:DNA-binding FadR family transcriptional regulator